MSERALTQKSVPTAITPVSSLLLQRTCSCGGTVGVRGECDKCRTKRLQLQRKTIHATEPTTVPPIVHDVLSSSGQPLDSQTRAFMEPHFGHDFSQVRVHTDAKAVESARAVDALAYTVGSDIVFNAQGFGPHTASGQKLLAHELTHVVQQRGAHVDLDRLALDGDVSGPAEREAETMAERVGAGGPIAGSSAAAPPTMRLQRARLQRKMVEDEGAGGCGICYGPQAAGIEAHQLIQVNFRSQYFEAVRKTKPSKQFTGNVHLTETEITEIGSAPGDDNFRLDIAVVDSVGDLSIGEIKPANTEQRLQGYAQLDFYADLITERRRERPRRMSGPIVQGAIEFPNPQVPNCTTKQWLHVNEPTRGVYTYYCTPTRKQLWKDANCRCWKKPDEKKQEKADRAAKDVGKGTDVTVEDKGKGPVAIDNPFAPPTLPVIAEPVTPTGPGAQPAAPPVEASPVIQSGPQPEAQPVVEPKPETTPETAPVEGEPGGDVISLDERRKKAQTETVEAPEGSSLPSAVAAFMALGYALRNSTIFKGLLSGMKRAVAKYLLPIEAVATLVLLTRGAKAEIGPGDSSLETLLENPDVQGMDVPDDVRAALKKAKRFHAALLKASKGGGEMSDEMRKALEEITKTIAEHEDEFTDEELEKLAQVLTEPQKVVPDPKMTVEEIKEALKRGEFGKNPAAAQKGGSGGGAGGDMPTLDPELSTAKPAPKAPPEKTDFNDDLRKRLADDKAATTLVAEMSVELGAGRKMDAAFAEEVLKLTRAANLTEDEAKAIADAMVTTTAKDVPAAELLESLKAAIARQQAAKAQGRALPAATDAPPVQPGGEAPIGVTTPPTPPATTPATPTPAAPPNWTTPFPDPNIMREMLEAADREAAENWAAKKAKEILADPKQYDHIPENKFEASGGILKSVKIQSGVDLPPVRVVGRKNGQLFTGTIITIPIAPVPGTTKEWRVESKPAPMYDAEGNKVRVFPPQTLTLRVGGGASGASTLRLP